MSLLAGVFGGVAVVIFVLGVYSPRWILRRYRYKREDWSEPAICHVFYPSLLLFGWIGMMGLALGILGAGFYVTALFFAGSAGGLILSLPTKEKYEKMF